MLTRIYIDHAVIERNRSEDRDDPPIVIKSGNKKRYAWEVKICGPSMVCYAPKFIRGVPVFIETHSKVEPVGERRPMTSKEAYEKVLSEMRAHVVEERAIATKENDKVAKQGHLADVRDLRCLLELMEAKKRVEAGEAMRSLDTFVREGIPRLAWLWITNQTYDEAEFSVPV